MKVLKGSIILVMCLIVSLQRIPVFAGEVGGDDMHDETYYSEEIDPTTKIEFDEENTIVLFAVGHTINWSIGNNVEKRTSTFHLKKNGKVSFGLKLSKTTNVTVGIIDSNNKKTYVKGEKNFVKTLTAPSAGTYRVFVKNKSGSKISVNGTYTR
ncbi:MAG: hypothetical protein PHD70_02005 [Anaerostipes sp.]|nr:hypothetical protein [Anaerostipes sp.]MDD3745231.1 hypothetical protein [Anaerostipes sp.]